MVYNSQFTSDIRNIPGTEKEPADALSRLAICSISTPNSIDLTAIAQDQSGLDSLDLTSDEYSCYKYSLLPLPVSKGTILCDTATGIPRPRVPKQHQRSVFDTLHSLLHSGVVASVKLISFGLIYDVLLLIGLVLALNVNALKFNVTFELPLEFSLRQKSGSNMFT